MLFLNEQRVSWIWREYRGADRAPQPLNLRAFVVPGLCFVPARHSGEGILGIWPANRKGISLCGFPVWVCAETQRLAGLINPLDITGVDALAGCHGNTAQK